MLHAVRRIARHSLLRPSGQATPGLPAAASLPIVEQAHREIDTVLVALETSAEGLSRVEAMIRRARTGPNEIAHEKPPPIHLQFLYAFKNPFIILLLALAVVSIITGDAKATIVISVMVFLSVLLRFFQEYRSGRAAEKLKAMVSTTATVSRRDASKDVPANVTKAFGITLHPGEPTLKEIPIRDLVPGDVIHLSAGDMVPADVRLLSSKDLFISQSILTGESLPVEKYDVLGSVVEKGVTKNGHLTTPLDLANVCFMGTNVVSGTAKAVVVATGGKTYFGTLAKHIVGKRAPTSFDKGVNGVSWLLIRFMLVMVPLVFLINGWTKGDWGEAFFFGVAMAVGLTPEMLPMIVTANLARGAVAMSRRKVIVKRLNAIQNFGAMDMLCTDKTGTLTQDRVILLKHLDINGEENDEVFEYAFLNSYFQTGLKNLLDVAILEHENLIHSKELTRRYIKCDEIPFDFQRRRMSVIVHEVFRGRDLLICKGAVEEILAICQCAEIDGPENGDRHLLQERPGGCFAQKVPVPVFRAGRFVPLTDDIRAKAHELNAAMNEDGLRVIAVAYKQVDSMPGRQYGVADESDLILCGYIAFLDPPKETAAPALAALHGHGIQVKILTGDNDRVARKVCKEVRLDVSATLLGSDIDGLTDAELETQAETTTLFAKLSPPQKARVIKALRRSGHTVGFLGDGINDAPALRDADVGISVDTAADIARESADIILLEKSLLVLEEGVLAGRNTFGNIIKYIKMTASSNYGNMFSMLVASVWLPFLPMLALHLLIQNLLYDISQIAIPFDSVDKEYLDKPRKWLVNDIGRFMLFIGPISSIFDMTTFALLWFVFGATTVANQSLFQSGWFIEGLLSQTLIIHMIRTARIPFLQSWAAWPLTLLTGIIMVIGVCIPFSPLGAGIGLQPLPWSYFPWLVATLLTYCVLTQAVKVWYIRRFGMWL
jgi:Mg2+-importing ATPase